MGTRQLAIMLDTSVWLDYFIQGRDGSATAVRLVREAVEHNARLLYPARIMSDLFLEIRRDAASWVRASTDEVSRETARACHDYAWGCMEDLHELAEAVETDEASVEMALRFRSLSEDLEDNFVLVAAQRAAVDYLVTCDRVLLAKATVPALGPQDMMAVLEARL